ncbi:hypothetical protein MTO96_023748 [Rhipicephalus appendiculatus]
MGSAANNKESYELCTKAEANNKWMHVVVPKKQAAGEPRLEIILASPSKPYKETYQTTAAEEAEAASRRRGPDGLFGTSK